MFTVKDNFIIPELNKHKDTLAKDQKYFWFLPTDTVTHTEIANVTKNSDGVFELTDFKAHQPYSYLSNGELENDIATYKLWGITNNNEEDYYDLKVNNKGFFYTKIKDTLIQYSAILEYMENDKTTIYALNKNNSKLKFVQAYLYKHGNMVLMSAGSADTSMKLDSFIVGFRAYIDISSDNKIDIEFTATIPNIDEKQYPVFSVKIGSNNTFLGSVKMDSIIRYKQHKPSFRSIQQITANSKTEFIFKPVITL